MKLYKVAIEGTSPILLNRFTDEAQATATSGTTTATVGDKGMGGEQAAAALYMDKDGEIPIMPGQNLFRCLIDAGKFFKAGKSKVTTLKTSLIPSCLSVNELVIPIKSPAPWQVDSRPVRIPATGGRIIRHRPMFQDWGLTFTLTLDEKIISPKLLRDIVDAAGSRIGLGDFRPDCKGMFGKFVVVSWEEITEK
jgi:hypothetical protein